MDISFNSEGERARKRRRSNETIGKDGEKEINIQVVVRCRYVLNYFVYHSQIVIVII
jgi:hypothetical protein